MKKLLLCSVLGALAVSDAAAQSAAKLNNPANAAIAPNPAPYTLAPGIPTGKTTVTPPREYSHFDFINSVTTQETRLVTLWGDSTVLQEFSSGASTVNFSAAGQYIQPYNALWNDASNPNFAGQAAISATSSYTVDSLTFFGAYIAGDKGGDAGKVDTMYLSVGVQDNTTYYWRKATAPWITAYTSRDTLWANAPIGVDSIKNAATSYGTGSVSAVTWYVPLNVADRAIPDPTTGSVDIKRFAFKLPSTLTVPAGLSIVYSVSFKSADTWVKNVDTVGSFDRLTLLFGGNGTVSKAMDYKYYDGDRSMSSLQFATFRRQFTPSIAIEGTNDATGFFFEYFASSVILNCPTCPLVGLAVNENALVGKVNAYPNPSATEFNVSFTSKEAANVTISISNMMGQVIATQNLGNQFAGQSTVANFNTAALSSGMYFYTIEANGARLTNRFSVAH